MKYWVKLNFLFFLIGVFLLGCQSFPAGEDLGEMQDEYSDSGIIDLSTSSLYKYYAMCRAAWKQYDAWEDSGWELNYFSNDDTETQWLIIPEGDKTYVIFRSSRALQNGSVDFYYNRRFGLRSVPFMEDSHLKAHHGFIEKYMSIRDRFFVTLAQFNTENIVLVGHSAGAAMASLVFMDLKSLYPDMRLNVVTFGMARIFNSKAAKWYEKYDENIIRVVNGRDFFPNLPPAVFGYHHIGRLIRIGDRHLWPLFSMWDHHPGYQKMLEARLREEGIDPESLGF